jgi:hypothetical protein
MGCTIDVMRRCEKIIPNCAWAMLLTSWRFSITPSSVSWLDRAEPIWLRYGGGNLPTSLIRPLRLCSLQQEVLDFAMSLMLARLSIDNACPT